jgi:nitroreductase
MLNQDALDTLFSHARTHNVWLAKPVSDAQLYQIYELMKWGATAANSTPARIVFVKSDAEKEKLAACVSAGNVDKVKTAPVTAIIGMDMAFYEQLPKLSRIPMRVHGSSGIRRRLSRRHFVIRHCKALI